jgi:hypothetical protein
VNYFEELSRCHTRSYRRTSDDQRSVSTFETMESQIYSKRIEGVKALNLGSAENLLLRFSQISFQGPLLHYSETSLPLIELISSYSGPNISQKRKKLLPNFKEFCLFN